MQRALLNRIFDYHYSSLPPPNFGKSQENEMSGYVESLSLYSTILKFILFLATDSVCRRLVPIVNT